MKLYVADYAPNPRRVRWVLNEKGITNIELVTLDIMKLEHKSHDIVAKSGASNLPVLELDDGSVISESVAIGRYIESLYPDPNLFGHDAREIADIEMWTRRLEQTLATPLMHGARMTYPGLAVLEEPNPDAAAYMLKIATEQLTVLDARLEGREFITAGRFTIADIMTVCALDFARIIRFRPDKSLENVARWLEAVRTRPSKPSA